LLSSFLAFWLPLVSTVGCYQLFAAARIEKNNKETQLSTTNSHRSKEQRILRQQQHLQQKRQRQMKQTYKKNMKIQQGNQTSNSQTLQENRMITSLPQNAARNILLTGNSNIHMLHCADDRFLLQLQLPKLLVIFFESQRFQLQDGANLQICAEHLTVLPAANEKSKLQSASNTVQMRSWLPTFAEKHRKVNEVQGEL
jgi:hypothetical protein